MGRASLVREFQFAEPVNIVEALHKPSDEVSLANSRHPPEIHYEWPSHQLRHNVPDLDRADNLVYDVVYACEMGFECLGDILELGSFPANSLCQLLRIHDLFIFAVVVHSSAR